MRTRLYIFIVMLICTISVSASDYRYVAGSGLVTIWDSDDVTSITTGKADALGDFTQLAFYVKNINSANPSYATTNAPSFKLSDNATYYTYFPFHRYVDFNPSAITVQFTNQAQNVNNSPSGLAPHDLCIGRISTTTSTSYTIQYAHTGSVMRITCQAPKTARIASLTLKAQSASIPVVATVNLLTQTASYSDYRSSVTLNLGNVSIRSGETITAYVMLPAIDLSRQQLTVTLTDENGTTYPLTSFKGPKMSAGKLYEVTFTDKARSAVQAKQMAIGTSTLAVEYPTAHLADITTDTSFDGYVYYNDIATEVSSAPTSDNAQRRYSITGTSASPNNKGLVIIRDANGKTKKQLIR